MIRRILAAAVTLALALLLLVACWPQLLGLERVLGVAQLVSFRGIAALVAVLLAVLLTLVALLSPRGRRFFAGLAVLLLAFSVVSTGVLAVRGFGNGALQTLAPGDLVVLSWNTLGEAPGAERIAELAVEQEADVVALPETSPDAAEQIATLMAAAGRPVQALGVQFDHISKARSTMLLVSTALGEYRVDETVGNTVTLPSVVAVPVDGTGPTIIAAHPVAPVPEEMDGWRASLDWLAERCADADADLVVAGDLNSTLDHWASLGSDVGLNQCRDAARATGNAAVGTWPTRMPPLLGTPIDHVLATDAWQIVGFRVLESEDGAGSDHRPVLAQLRPAS
ncbi:endonuclease/exonuclease/phosphatase family protein [Protaetiibacter intestinalis]|uniref:Endonuclease/exonuclease/phosphatase family protein n=1 Tax=Protaetiibacter intestinalis TaxID=2419774 RepID=A0A387B0R4_9MICO|nr:endonuclease/exonuclease/phosphatase family protein [Protaetiibacter intestinalis]AYF97084.1 endonuclease/exonuclease/phosphatase family protein [Protaetiibacter intestinalis]